MSKRKVCFDACIFIALMNPKNYDPSIISSIHSLMALVDRGEVYAVCSSLIQAELLDGSFEQMEARCDGRKGELVDVDAGIAALARRIRNKTGLKVKDGYKSLEVPDCVYIATAITYECHSLVTLDGIGPHNRHTILNCAEQLEKEFKLKVVSPLDAADQKTLAFPQSEPA